jgi:hypothetical protein
MSETESVSDDDDLEPGWGGLAILLWPVRAYFAVKVWIHNRLHPDEPEHL